MILTESPPHIKQLMAVFFLDLRIGRTMLAAGCRCSPLFPDSSCLPAQSNTDPYGNKNRTVPDDALCFSVALDLTNNNSSVTPASRPLLFPVNQSAV